MKKAILVATIGAMTLGVNAGDWGKAPVGKAPIEECIDLGGEISVGYATDYYYHGVHWSQDNVWADVNYTFDGLAVPVTVGATYLNGISPIAFDQLDVYANAALGTFAGFDTTLGYTYPLFPETSLGEFGEISLGLRRSLGFADLVLGTNYLTGDRTVGESEGWYHQVGLEKSFAITDNISLVLAGGAGYLDGLINSAVSGGQQGHGWNHYYAKASLPIQLNCRATLTPFVGYENRDGAIGFGGQLRGLQEDDNVYSGISLNVTF
ncbi:MAG: hypothetical protein ABL994_01965 [Verrucomicrobiales bacterium]